MSAYTESLSVNPWGPVIEQEQRIAINKEISMLIELGLSEVEDEQDFDFISKYHAPINY